MLQRYTATMLDLLAGLVVSNTTKIVLLSLDGLAGLPHLKTGQSEMEPAGRAHLDRGEHRVDRAAARHQASRRRGAGGARQGAPVRARPARRRPRRPPE